MVKVEGVEARSVASSKIDIVLQTDLEALGVKNGRIEEESVGAIQIEEMLGYRQMLMNPPVRESEIVVYSGESDICAVNFLKIGSNPNGNK